MPGRNKNSDAVNKNNPNHDADVKFAHDNKLWHYHIGIKTYNTRNGYGKYTSEFVIHYQRFSDSVRIVKMDNHSPFALPRQLEHLEP